MRDGTYNPLSKALHWIMAAIWIAAWFIGAAAGYMRDAGSSDRSLTGVHKALASTLILLIVIRVAWRLTHPAPCLPNTMSPRLKRAASFGHIMLYAVALLAVPLSGWLWTSVAGHAVPVLGLFSLPPLTPPARQYYALSQQLHVALAWGSGALVLGHILIALKHHFIDRDGVLRSMLPKQRTRPDCHRGEHDRLDRRLSPGS